ncbi:MAG TPA: hypothetical protein VKY51_04880, partial [Fredinandcohnia sp.]|nr:hypothetical protein [Fredinandcohnia sp.]
MERLHLGSQTRASLQRWAIERGASPAAAAALAHLLVARFAGRTAEVRPARRLIEAAEATFADDLPEATPVLDPDGTIRYAVRLADASIVE